MKIKVFKIFSWFAIIVWASVIFIFSAQTGAQSSALSKGLIWNTVSLYSNLFHKGLTIMDISNITISLEGNVREIAHGISYFILGGLVYNALHLSVKNKSRAILYSVLICFVYSLTDEFHQLFVPNRSFQILDLSIDLIGNIIGAWFISLIYSKKRRKNSETK